MISIIIPTLNEEDYLPRLIESIKRQNFSDYEIIVSDGGSSDRTIEIAESFGAKTVVDSSIKHPSAQRNNGSKIAQGEILVFVDADSVLPENFLSFSLDQFQKRALGVSAFYINFHPNKFFYNLYSFVSNTTCFFKQYGKYPAAIGAGIMIKKEINDKINGFDLSVLLAEDCDYCARATSFGKFRMIKGIKLLYSSRRIEKEGFYRSGWKWLKMGLFTLRNKRIRTKIFDYDFGVFGKRK